MRIRLNRGIEFTPGLWPTIALTLLLPILISLGYWQLHRASEKEALQMQKAARLSGQARSVTSEIIDAKSWNHYPVVVDGRYDPTFQVLLDNRMHKGRPGFYVITPFKIEGGEVRILINRGWIPLGDSREHLPLVEIPAGNRTIRGRARTSYSDRYKLDTALSKITEGINIWQTMDIAVLQKLVPYAIQPIIVELDPSANESDFLREWVVQAGSPASKNVGYAVQWFALAGLLVGIYLFLNIRRTNV